MGDSSGHVRRGERALVAVPPEYAGHLVDLVSRFGVPPVRLLHGTGIAPAQLEHDRLELPKGAFFALVERALALTGEPGLGFYYGLSLKLSSHGPLGLLAMTSPTLRDALLAAARFIQLRATELTLRIDEQGHEVAIAFAHAVPPTLQVFFTEALLVTLLQIARTLTGRQLAARCELAFPEPPHFRRFAHLLPKSVRFAQSENRLLAPASLLDVSVLTSDSVVARRVERACQAELAALEEHLPLVARIRRELRATRAAFPSLGQAAERRQLSERTLKRRLAAHGTSYRALVEEARRERAAELLSGSSLSVERIATLLGYADKASFHRAFRRWLGTTPESYRRASLAKHTDPSPRAES